MKTQTTKTKKVSFEVYQHLATKLYISKCYGYALWNIWYDADRMQEHSIGFDTKWQAVEFLDNLNK